MMGAAVLLGGAIWQAAPVLAASSGAGAQGGGCGGWTAGWDPIVLLCFLYAVCLPLAVWMVATTDGPVSPAPPPPRALRTVDPRRTPFQPPPTHIASGSTFDVRRAQSFQSSYVRETPSLSSSGRSRHSSTRPTPSAAEARRKLRRSRCASRRAGGGRERRRRQRAGTRPATRRDARGQLCFGAARRKIG